MRGGAKYPRPYPGLSRPEFSAVVDGVTVLAVSQTDAASARSSDLSRINPIAFDLKRNKRAVRQLQAVPQLLTGNQLEICR